MSTQPIKTYPIQAEPSDCSQELDIFRLSLPVGNSPMKGTRLVFQPFALPLVPHAYFQGVAWQTAAVACPEASAGFVTFRGQTSRMVLTVST